jgi:hypothetical protein
MGIINIIKSHDGKEYVCRSVSEFGFGVSRASEPGGKSFRSFDPKAQASKKDGVVPVKKREAAETSPR